MAHDPTRIRFTGSPALVLSALLMVPACTQPAAPVGTAESNTQTVVQLEVTYRRALESAGVSLDAEAHFIRYRASSQDELGVASLLGVTRDDDLTLGSCRAVTDGALTSSGLEVSLLDAGPLTVRNEGVVETVLEPHRYPELLPFVTGVVYGQEGMAAHEPAVSSRLEVEATGGEDVGPFVAATTLGRGFPNLVVTRPRDIELSWTAAQGNSGSVVAELRWSGARAGAVRCRAADDGHLDLTRALPQSLATVVDDALREGAVVQASVSRTELATLDAPGAGAGRLLVTLRDSASVPTATQ